jgi:hypothetical protein
MGTCEGLGAPSPDTKSCEPAGQSHVGRPLQAPPFPACGLVRERKPIGCGLHCLEKRCYLNWLRQVICHERMARREAETSVHYCAVRRKPDAPFPGIARLWRGRHRDHHGRKALKVTTNRTRLPPDAIRLPAQHCAFSRSKHQSSSRENVEPLACERNARWAQ